MRLGRKRNFDDWTCLSASPVLQVSLRSVRKETHENPIVIPFWRSVMLQPLPFFLWFRLRCHWYRLRGVPLKVLNHGTVGTDHISKNVIPYNLRKSRGYDRRRTERLIN